MARPRIVITGASGRIGTILRQRLGDRYDVVGVDRAGTLRTGVRRADMTRLRRARRAVAGADVLVDLAAVPATTSPWRVVHGNNLPATWNAFGAAVETGVRRVVFASSGRVMGMYEREPPYAEVVAGRYEGLDPQAIPPIGVDWPVRPDSPYGVGKALGEAAARYFSDEFGLSAICLRLGTIRGEDRPVTPHHFATYLSYADLARLVAAAVEAPSELLFGVYYGVSANTWRFWDLVPGREEIGFEPQDDSEGWR